MPALAITDLANAFGLVKFYRAARARGVKPIFGCDVWLTHEAERDQPFRVLLLAQSRAGYLKLADWLSRAYRSNQHRGHAEMRREWLREGTDGLIALSGARDGDVGRRSSQGNRAGAAQGGAGMGALFPGRYYLEVQRAGHADDDALVAATVALARELALPVVATHPVQFLRRDDFRAHEARVCIAEGHVLADPRRPRRFTPDQYFKSQAEMAAALRRLPGSAREFGGDRAALQPDDSARQELTCPTFRRRRRHDRRAPAQRSRRRARAAARRALSRSRRRATRSAPNTSRGSTSRPARSCRWASPATS